MKNWLKGKDNFQHNNSFKQNIPSDEMEDEAVKDSKTNKFYIFVPGNDIPLCCDYRTPFPQMIDYDEDEAIKPNSPISKLNRILDNHGDYKEKILIVWHFRDDEQIKPPQPERVSASDLYGLIGNFVVRNSENLVKFYNSKEDLLRAVEEGR